MQQLVNLVVSCTSRKKSVPSRDLRLRTLAGEQLPKGLQQWLARLAKDDAPGQRASDLYAGDHWRVAQAIPVESADRDLAVRLWVSSAGYGLLPDSELIRPYSATFSPGHADSVAVLAPSSPGDSVGPAWWTGLSTRPRPSGVPRTIADLASAEPRVPIVVVASEAYITAMSSDLLEAAATLASGDLLSMVSIGATERRLGQLQAHLLPADARFEAVVGGIRAALNARLARFLFRRLPRGATASKGLLSRMLARAATELPPLRHFQRERVSDDEVRKFIERGWRSTRSSKTVLLRRFRASGAACEQRRFSSIFNEVAGVVRDDE